MQNRIFHVFDLDANYRDAETTAVEWLLSINDGEIRKLQLFVGTLEAENALIIGALLQQGMYLHLFDKTKKVQISKIIHDLEIRLGIKTEEKIFEKRWQPKRRFPMTRISSRLNEYRSL